MGSKLMVANYVNETSSNNRSRRNGGTTHGVDFTTSNDGAIYPTNRKSASRIKSVNGGTSVGKGPMYPLSSIETRLMRMALSRVRKSKSLEQTVWRTMTTETPSMKI